MTEKATRDPEREAQALIREARALIKDLPYYYGLEGLTDWKRRAEAWLQRTGDTDGKRV